MPDPDLPTPEQVAVRRALVGHADETIGERYSSVTMDERRAAVGEVVRMVRGE